MVMIASEDVRRQAGVAKGNKYLSPLPRFDGSCHRIPRHPSHEYTDRVAAPKLLTATKIRHHTSTTYAQLDLHENDRGLFYRHMGHTKEINENSYHCPLGALTTTKVGRHLTHSMLVNTDYNVFRYALFNIFIITTIVTINHVRQWYTCSLIRTIKIQLLNSSLQSSQMTI